MIAGCDLNNRRTPTDYIITASLKSIENRQFCQKRQKGKSSELGRTYVSAPTTIFSTLTLNSYLAYAGYAHQHYP